VSLKVKFGQVSVTHAYIPSYSRDRAQEDLNLKPAQGNSFVIPSLKKPHHKKGLVEWLKVWILSSNPSTAKKM
jgi:hypothetical protein